MEGIRGENSLHSAQLVGTLISSPTSFSLHCSSSQIPTCRAAIKNKSPKPTMRKIQCLSVTVSCPAPSALDISSGGGGRGGGHDRYIEIKEVQVDSRLRLFSFHSDYRPPYV